MAMDRNEFGVFIYSKVCMNAKALVLRRMEKQYKENFLVLNNYVMELKEANPRSTISILIERKDNLKFPIFKRIYICLSVIREGKNYRP